jgi:hypothetical protein
MENMLGVSLSGQQELVVYNEMKSETDVQIREIPTLQGLLAKTEETSLDFSESLKWKLMGEREFQREIEELPT